MIRPAIPEDTKTIARFIRGLAEYEKLSHEVHLDESRLQEHLFGPRPFAEVLLAEEKREVVGFALFFHNYSTFEGRPGIYLEDLFVEPEHRGQGHGKALLVELAAWRSSAVAAGSNGSCSTGTNQRFSFIDLSGPCR